MMKKITTLLLAFFMILSLAAPVAAEGESMDVSGSKEASPTLLQASERETTVTLSLPSAEYKNKIDLVFVMDDSTSTLNAGFDFPGESKKLFDQIVENNPGIELKVAVIKFKGYAKDMLGTGLTVYDDSSKDAIVNAIKSEEVVGHGSNAHSGLVMAEELLSADTEVEDSHKYVIFLTDGKNYIWNDENNEPTTIYAQYLRKTSVSDLGYPVLNQYANSYNREQGKVYITIPEITDHEPFHFAVGDTLNEHSPDNSEYFRRVYNSDNAELTSKSAYDAPAYYSGYFPESDKTNCSLNNGAPSSNGPRSGEVIEHALTNAPSTLLLPYKTWYEYIPEEGTFWEDIPYLQINPYNVVKNEDGTYSYDLDSVNEDFWLWHPDCMMKGTYVTAHYWKETLVEKYNAACIASFAKGSGGGANIVGSFVHWAVEESDFSANITNAGDIAEVFENIDNDIRYMVGSGVVTDKISENFDLKEPADFRMTLNGEDLTSAKDGDKWVFGTADETGKYPYELEYDAASKTIKWTLNVPVENTRPVTLSYDLLLKDEYAIDGTKYPTNESAVLHYVSTDGKYKGDYTFEKPEVEYAVTSVEGTKTWDDDNNRDGKRPEEIRVVLLDENGTEVGKTLVTAENGWKYEFTNLYKYEDGEEKVYTVKEFEVPEGYEATYDGYNIKNTHAPETIEITGTKTWDDDEDRDGLRPEEIRVVLLDENGTEYGKTLVTAENGWKYEFKGLFKYENGKEKVYTVKEFEVPEGYEATYEGYNVTNTHAPETTTVTVEKKWEDDNDAEGIRPEAVTVALLADGKEVMTAELNEKNGWKYTFESTEETQLYKYKEQGKEVEYTVEEKEVPEGYVSEVDGYTITNYLYTEPGEFEIVKIWKDEDNKNNTRPESITVHLFADGVEIGEFEITAEEDWKLGIAGVTKIVGTREVKFTATEDPVKGYSTSIDGLTITNTLNPPTGVKGTTSFWMMAVCAAAAGVLILRKKEEE